MTITVANTALTNTVDYWRNRTNEIADALTTKAVTTDSNTATGNAAITGTFTANVFVTGNSTINSISNSSIFTLRTAAISMTVNSSAFYAGNSTANVLLTYNDLKINGVSVIAPTVTVNTQTSGTSAQLIDYFDSTVYRSADYVLSITDNAANAYHTVKSLIIQDAGDAYLTEYGMVWSNTNLGAFTANANATHARLYFTPSPANTQVKGVRTSVVV